MDTTEILKLAEQVAGVDVGLGFSLACRAKATVNEARATLTPICFALFERMGGEDNTHNLCDCEHLRLGSPWTNGR